MMLILAALVGVACAAGMFLFLSLFGVEATPGVRMIVYTVSLLVVAVYASLALVDTTKG
jgi:hypothetical protein